MLKSKKLIIALALVIGLCVGIISGGMITSKDLNTANASEGSNDSTLTVYGEGRVSIKPDIAYVNVGVENLDKDAKKAQQDNKSAMDKVMAKLKSLGIAEKDIQTSDYYVRLEEDYRNDKREILGFRVSNTVKVTLRNVDKVGEVLAGAYEAGANTFHGITFDVENRDDAYNKAMEQAIAKAKEKAESMAKAAGVKLDKMDVICEGLTTPQYRGGYRDMKEEMSMDAGSVPVSPGELDVTANVTIIYKVK